jgi:polyisoprenoid-binding protein YceI
MNRASLRGLVLIGIVALISNISHNGMGRNLAKLGSESGVTDAASEMSAGFPRVSSESPGALSESPRANNADGARYKIDPGRSHLTVKALAGGLLSALAHNHNIEVRSFSGEARFTYGSFEPAALEFSVKSESLAVVDKVSDKDRGEIEQKMRQDVLEAQSYPEIRFKSSSVSATKVADGQYQVKMQGTLSLHGQSHEVTIPAKVELGSDSLRARGEFSLRQSAYGIKPVSAAGGTIKVKDEVKLSFDITARG